MGDPARASGRALAAERANRRRTSHTRREGETRKDFLGDVNGSGGGVLCFVHSFVAHRCGGAPRHCYYIFYTLTEHVSTVSYINRNSNCYNSMHDGVLLKRL